MCRKWADKIGSLMYYFTTKFITTLAYIDVGQVERCIYELVSSFHAIISL